MPVAVVRMTGADASEETGLFQVVTIQPGTSGRACKAAVPYWPPPAEATEPQTDVGAILWSQKLISLRLR
jgi:hypothetical protein